MARVPTDRFDARGLPRWRLGEHPWLADAPPVPPRARVIVDNDFAGDPDDLFQLVHHVLSPAVEIPLVVSSHLRRDAPGPATTAADGLRVVEDLCARLGLDAADRLVAGAEEPLVDVRTPRISAAVDAIVAEALRDDPRPLFYAAGGGLTDLASAYLRHPEIAHRLVVVWIGGFEHEPLPWLDASAPVTAEYNLSTDVAAAQVVFDAPDLEVWQVPRSTYRTCVMSDAEMRVRVRGAGALGRHLYDEVRAEMVKHEHLRPQAEAYVLGDSPLVLLTALADFWEAGPSSCEHVVVPKPALRDDGRYAPRPDAAPMRVYGRVDVRLMHEDLHAKLVLFERWRAGAE
ncbi:nucleoside hydrolase [Cellulomonas iranensis]|uniref:nucleoside hydrolase n=1 Tax=Cellulomonas iranensis TaxID=76862 RepID=UPI0013D8C265|nr:nucleoside hydrolase [Cellulomonas iranensis]